MNLEQYKIIANRRQGYDALVWRAPPLAIAGQAFLLSTALSAETRPFDALLLSLISLIVGLASSQVMAKHRQLDIEDARRLKIFELSNKIDGFEVIHGLIPPPRGIKRIWPVRFSAFKVWICTLLGFVIISIYAIFNSQVKFF